MTMTMTTPARYKLADGTLDQEDRDALIRWLQGNPWLTQGPLTQELEQKWASWLGVPHAVFVNSGSSANLLMLAALDASKRLANRKVVVPAVSWATTVAPVIQLGFEPLLCDGDHQTFGLDVRHLEELCARHRPAAVIAVHVLGVPCDLDGILALRARHGFLLMEDACAATGSRFAGRRVGTFGDLSSFSFFYGHHLTTIEGGMVCTGDRRLDDLLRALRSHGWARELAPETEAAWLRPYDIPAFQRQFTFYHPGYNVRSSDLNAHIGLGQLARADRAIARRRENHARYQARFAGGPGFSFQSAPKAEIASISFGAVASSEAHRERVAHVLASRGIETRPIGAGNTGRQPFWCDRYPTAAMPFADRVFQAGFLLPNHPGLGPEDIDAICETVLSVGSPS